MQRGVVFLRRCRLSCQIRGNGLRISRGFCEVNDEEIMDRKSYREEREMRLNNLVEEKNQPASSVLYPPLPDNPTHTIMEYRSQYDHISPGEGVSDSVILCGRIYSKRQASKKLIFFDLGSNGSRVQIMASLNSYEPTSSGLSFDSLHSTAARGDIVCMEFIFIYIFLYNLELDFKCLFICFSGLWKS